MGSIADSIIRLQNIKTAIRNALVNKGITGASSHAMADFATDIGNIETGIDTSDATATTNDIVYPKTAYVDGEKITGGIQTETTHNISVTAQANSGNTITSNGTYTISGSNTDSNVNKLITNVSSSASGSVVVNVPASTPNLQAKTTNASTSQQVITPDSGYDGLSSVTINAATKQSKTVSPSTSSQTVTPDSGYYGLSQVTVNAMNLQSKTAQFTPSANWSGSYTNPTTISPDSGYSGMSQVQASVPMCRDNMLMTASAVSTPTTVYNGDTAQSNSQKLLRIGSTKSGMVYTNSYLYVQPNSYLGDASPSDVVSGKTFSSVNGIQLTGTGSSGGVTYIDVSIQFDVQYNDTANTFRFQNSYLAGFTMTYTSDNTLLQYRDGTAGSYTTVNPASYYLTGTDLFFKLTRESTSYTTNLSAYVTLHFSFT